MRYDTTTWHYHFSHSYFISSPIYERQIYTIWVRLLDNTTVGKLRGFHDDEDGDPGIGDF